MRKFCWQRWALVFLLLTRLVMGELGHAMPVAAIAAAEQAAPAIQSEASPCHGSEDAGEQMPKSQPASVGENHQHSPNHSSDEPDCCKTGDCECPCLHVPCAALDASTLDSLATVSPRTPRGMDGLISQRPSGLFRPPA